MKITKKGFSGDVKSGGCKENFQRAWAKRPRCGIIKFKALKQYEKQML